MELQVKFTQRQHDAVSRAIANGAFADAHAQITALMVANKDHDRLCDNFQQDAEDLCSAARAILGAQPMQDEVAPISKLSNDDIIHACNLMEAEAKKELETPRGHFATAYNETLLNAARAFYHADSRNQTLAKVMFGYLYVYYHRKYALKTNTEVKA